eukprot:9055258-Pyramimonas_sp.AAC.1
MRLYEYCSAWHASSSRRISPACLADPTGENITDPQTVCSRFAQHWGEVHAARACDPDALLELAPFVQRVPQNVEWELCYDDFVSCFAKLKDAAAGPDGLPYS